MDAVQIGLLAQNESNVFTNSLAVLRTQIVFSSFFYLENFKQVLSYSFPVSVIVQREQK